MTTASTPVSTITDTPIPAAPPTPAGFVHLHVHSQYSLLDGAIRIPDLLEKCKEYGMDSVAVTDHGAMYGALDFYLQAKKAGIKAIIGCEFYMTPGHLGDKEKGFHLVALAMNLTGYKNLMKLCGIAQFAGFYRKPRIDMATLTAHNEGLIILTACLHGQIPWLIANNDMTGARAKALEFQEIFGDRLYFELQENGIPEQTPVNTGMKQLAAELGITTVATNDCHYLNREDAHAHEILLCIQMNHTLNDSKRFKFSSDQFYFKSPQEMKALFHHTPEAIAATVAIADRCHLEIETDTYYFPIFPVAEGETLETSFADACREGLKERFAAMRKAGVFSPAIEEQYKKRLTHEIEVINTMGFPGYFLIVADFINWAKDQGIPVGPGRGSGAGSLAAYCMRITNIDPIPYGLLFERFLNIERKSMPDFDVDFCQERRGEVIDYVQNKYGGASHVAQILTYGTMKARGAIRDVGRAMDIPLAEVDKVAKLVPEELKMTIKSAIALEPRLQEMASHDPRIAELLRVAQALEGLARHTSTHAAGVVVAPGPMVDYLPTCRGKEGETLTQYDMFHTEKTGLIKFDFLGLKTLTVIDKAIKHIKSDLGTVLDIDTIPMDDIKTYELLCRGDALGVFQLESSGMRELLVKMAPNQFSDLIALVALYRPGPLESGMVNDFVETKHGRAVANYPLPQLKPVLEETYGVIVYQEQVMQIANILASYSLGDADNLRRAMGKKKASVMEQEKVKFLTGAVKNGVAKDKAEYIFDLMAKFAGYGFNKSHSAAYALICYQTAYLKAHYPAQFMAALLSCDMNNTDKIVLYISECRDHQIEVLPPDINESLYDFSVINDRVRFGLAAVKNVGKAALDSIIEEREKSGKYASLMDFCTRIDARRVNSRVIESLIKAGAFDSLGCKRSQLFAALAPTMEQAKATQRDKQSGQMSLFGLAPQAISKESQSVPLPDIAEWGELERLAFEKETVGFYITGHPLEDVLPAIRTVVDTEIGKLGDWGDDQPVRVGGLIRSCKTLKSKKGDPMAFVSLEDVLDTVEVVVFPETFARTQHLLSTTEPVIVQGLVQKDERGAKILADAIDLLPAAREKYTESITIQLQAATVTRQRLDTLKNICHQFHGPCPLLLTLHFPGRGEVDIEIRKDITIRPCQEFTEKTRALLGDSALTFRKKALVAPARKKWSKNGNGSSHQGSIKAQS